MQSAGNIAQTLLGSTAVIDGSPWPVWKDSKRATVAFKAISKREALETWWKAKRLERRSHVKNRHGGSLGRVALAVLDSLLFSFLNHRTGRLDPAVKTLAASASVSPRACHLALKKLRALGIIAWTRRCAEGRDDSGRFQLKQLSNAYAVARSQEWGEPIDDPPPPPARELLGSPPYVKERSEQIIEAQEAGDRLTAIAVMEQDPKDRLNAALARFARRFL